MRNRLRKDYQINASAVAARIIFRGNNLTGDILAQMSEDEDSVALK